MAATASRSEEATRIFLRPIASPFPLGFSALGTASLLVAGSELGWFSGGDRTVVALVLVALAFPLQLLSSVFGFLGRDSSAATGFGVQAGVWMVVGLDRLLSAPGSTSSALGVMLCAGAAWAGMCAIGAAMGKLIPAAVLMLVALRFLATGIYQLTSNKGVEHAAGVIGLSLVALCAYAVIALEIESLQRRTVLPVFRRGAGLEAMHGSLVDQDRRLEHEPGVREQL